MDGAASRSVDRPANGRQQFQDFEVKQYGRIACPGMCGTTAPAAALPQMRTGLMQADTATLYISVFHANWSDT